MHKWFNKIAKFQTLALGFTVYMRTKRVTGNGFQGFYKHNMPNLHEYKHVFSWERT